MKLFRRVVGSVLWAALSSVAGREVDFRQHEVVLGVSLRPTVLTGFLTGGPVADLVVVDIDDETGERRVRIHSFDGSAWVPGREATLRPDVSFVDVARIGERDRLVTYSLGAPGRLSWFDPETASERELASVTCGFEPPRASEVPHVDVTHDVNGDGRDDLVVPDVGGFWVLVQVAGGAFADPVQVGQGPDLSRILGADGYRYDPWSQSRVHRIDYDHDGRGDLVYWDSGHFDVHVQDERGLFAAVPKAFATEVPFDSDDLSALATGDMRGSVLHSLADLNGDGVGDLVVYSLEGNCASRKRSRYDVHLGERTPQGGTVFAADAGITFESKDSVYLGLERHDFDGDGQLDLMLTTIDTRFLTGSLWKRIKGAMGDDVLLVREFYRMSGGRYRDEPDDTRITALDGPPSHRERGWVPLELVLSGGKHESRAHRKEYPSAFNTMLSFGDVTGDGRLDLIGTDHPYRLYVTPGAPGPGVFSDQHVALRLEMPNDEEYMWLADLNRDGKQDVVLHRPFTERDGHGKRLRPPGAEPHRVTLLVTR